MDPCLLPVTPEMLPYPLLAGGGGMTNLPPEQEIQHIDLIRRHTPIVKPSLGSGRRGPLRAAGDGGSLQEGEARARGGTIRSEAIKNNIK